MDSKACTKCGAVKPLSEFYKREKRYISICKKCCKEDGKQRHIKNKEYENLKNKKYREKNIEKIKKMAKNHYVKNKEKIKNKSNSYFFKNKKEIYKYRLNIRKNLGRAYIVGLLFNQGFTPEQITLELIELKREQLEMVRLSRQLKKAAKENNDQSN